MQTFEFALAKNPEKRLALITGDREDIKVGDVWVNSENTNMQMDRYYGRSTSAMVRYLGATLERRRTRWSRTRSARNWRRSSVRRSAWCPPRSSSPAPGALRETNGVKRIFHVASVQGEPRVGYTPDHQARALREERLQQGRRAGVPKPRRWRRFCFPSSGPAPAAAASEEHAERCFTAAIEALESQPAHPIKAVYFYVWSDADLETCLTLARHHAGLTSV